MSFEKFTLNSLMEYGRFALVKYGIHTIKDRAIPSLTDGLKPVQRRILYSMFTNNLKPANKALKAAVTVGDTMGSYHPHGDSAIFDAMGKMVNCCEPLIDGNGSNWGSLTEASAASRYVEARLTQFAFDNFFDPNYTSIMDMELNYDDRLHEPVALPSKTIHLFVNGSLGIAVGSRTQIPAFTLASVNKLLIEMLSSKDRIETKTAMKILKFANSTGGRFVSDNTNRAAFKVLLEQGRASIQFEPIYRFENGGARAIITGFPMLLRSGTHFERLATLDCVSRYVDETSIETGVRIVVEPKKGTKFNEETFAPVRKLFLDKQAYNIYYLKESVEEVDGEVKVNSVLTSNGVIDTFYDWIEWRKSQFLKSVNWRIDQQDKINDRLRLQLLAHEKRDVLDKCRDAKDPKQFLIDKLKIDDADASYLLGMTVMQLTRISGDKIRQQIKETNQRIDVLKKKLKRVNASIVEELTEAFK